jgi:hypothetical protein
MKWIILKAPNGEPLKNIIVRKFKQGKVTVFRTIILPTGNTKFKEIVFLEIRNK